MTCTRRWLGAVGLALAACAVGCSTPELQGDTRVIYESGARKGRKGRSDGIRMVLVHRGNATLVNQETGTLLERDRATKVISDALLADMVGRIRGAGFDDFAEPMEAGGPALPPGGRSALIIEVGGTARRIATPYPDGGKSFAEAYRAMMTEFLEVYQNSTSFHAGAGTEGGDRPNWETKTSFGEGR
ncbi:MAG: hypothetical protein ACYTGX_02605 [Planctomycetota bacterium]|jgi:hypothetical protein